MADTTTPPVCAEQSCDRPVLAKRLCVHHYGQERRRRIKDGAPVRPGRVAECLVEGCDRSPVGQSLCRMHYERKRKGRPIGGALPLRAVSGEGHLHPSGYRTHSRNRVTMLEHRWVMEQHLGRALLPHESVHHLNGQRSQNNISNLELWSTSQPAGQRVVDKVAWALEVVDNYPELVAAAMSNRSQLALM